MIYSILQLVSEQSGFAPLLVLDIKKAIENRGKSRSTTPEYKTAIKTLRPHKFIRESEKFNSLSAETKHSLLTFETEYYKAWLIAV
jgi:hypothetical protein